MKKLASVFVLMFLLVSAPPAHVVAQNQNKPASGLSVAPTRNQLVVQRNTTKEFELTIKNVTDSDLTAIPTIYDFRPGGLSGEPVLITDPKDSSPASVKAYVTGLHNLDLKVGEQKKLSLKLSIPQSAAPGAYYGAIVFKAVPLGSDKNPDQTGVSLTANVGSLVLVEVPGNLREGIQMQKAKAYDNDLDRTFFIRQPSHIGVQIKNLGNGFSQPFGTVKVANSGGKIIFSSEVNNSTPRGNILPGGTRLFKVKFTNLEKKTVNGKEITTEKNPLSRPGKYRVSAYMAYTNGGEVLVATSTFWYLPTWFLAVVLAVVLVLSYVIWRFKRTARVFRTRRSRG